MLPKPGLYRHFRNRELYRLLFIAKRSEEEDAFDCIYMPLYESGQKYCKPAQVMSRPVAMWLESVEYPVGGMIDGLPYGPRFMRVGD